MDCVPQLTLYNSLLGFFFTIIFILSLLGNSAVVLTICKGQRRAAHSVTSLFLLNLAIADLLRSVTCIPPTLMSQISRCWLLGPYVCKLAAYLQPVTVCASAYTLAVIALERYHAICRPLQTKSWLSKRRTLMLILSVWLVAFVGNSGALFIYDAVPYRTHWSCRSTVTPLTDFFYQIHVTMLLLLTPLTVMLCLYWKIIRTLHSDSQPEMEPSNAAYCCLEGGRGSVGHKSSMASWLFSSLTDQSFRTNTFHYDPMRHFWHLYWKESNKRMPGLSGSFLSVGPYMSSERLPVSSTIAQQNTTDRIVLVQIKDSKNNSSALCTLVQKQACGHDVQSQKSCSGTPALRPPISGKISVGYDCGYMLRSNHQGKIIETRKRVTRMLIIIVIAFLMCWTPSFIWWLVIRTSDLVEIRLWNGTVNTFITLLTYVSTCTNPVTYCFMNQRFRRSILVYFWCCPFKACRKSSKLKSISSTNVVLRYKSVPEQAI